MRTKSATMRTISSAKYGLSTLQLILVALFLSVHYPLVGAWAPSPRSNRNNQAPKLVKDDVDRRSALAKIVSLATGIMSSGTIQQASAEPPLNLPVLQSNTSDSNPPAPKTKSKAPTFEAYYITPDEFNVRSKLDKIDSQRFLQQMASIKNSNDGGGAVWLGEHHNSAADHDFQATFIREVHKHRQKHFNSKSPSNMMAIGLEQVQQEFQPILDAYIDGKISLDRMRFMVQWDKRWTWSFDNYKTIFEAARQLQIPLLALNVDSEDLSLVEKEGYPGLPKEKLRKYIKDP
jgi:Haem-binding uptake, Tiki superfamily, ChaN